MNAILYTTNIGSTERYARLLAEQTELPGIYRPMMEIMVKTAGRSLAEKKDRTPEEDDMLDDCIAAASGSKRRI